MTNIFEIIFLLRIISNKMDKKLLCNIHYQNYVCTHEIKYEFDSSLNKYLVLEAGLLMVEVWDLDEALAGVIHSTQHLIPKNILNLWA